MGVGDGYGCENGVFWKTVLAWVLKTIHLASRALHNHFRVQKPQKLHIFSFPLMCLGTLATCQNAAHRHLVHRMPPWRLHTCLYAIIILFNKPLAQCHTCLHSTPSGADSGGGGACASIPPPHPTSARRRGGGSSLGHKSTSLGQVMSALHENETKCLMWQENHKSLLGKKGCHDLEKPPVSMGKEKCLHGIKKTAKLRRSDKKTLKKSVNVSQKKRNSHANGS